MIHVDGWHGLATFALWILGLGPPGFMLLPAPRAYSFGGIQTTVLGRLLATLAAFA